MEEDLKTASRSPRVEILGIEVSAIDMEQALTTIERWLDSADRNYVCVNTVNSLLAALDDPELA